VSDFPFVFSSCSFELEEQFGDDPRIMDMVIAAMPTICTQAGRTLLYIPLSETLPTMNDYRPKSRGTTNADDRKKEIQIQSLVNGNDVIRQS
jgi:hypothetical protein